MTAAGCTIEKPTVGALVEQHGSLFGSHRREAGCELDSADKRTLSRPAVPPPPPLVCVIYWISALSSSLQQLLGRARLEGASPCATTHSRQQKSNSSNLAMRQPAQRD